MSTTAPFQAVLEEIKSEYTLVVLGHRDEAAEFYRDCSVSLLILFAEKKVEETESTNFIPTTDLESISSFQELDVV